jgi:hypothetical protein
LSRFSVTSYGFQLIGYFRILNLELQILNLEFRILNVFWTFILSAESLVRGTVRTVNHTKRLKDRNVPIFISFPFNINSLGRKSLWPLEWILFLSRFHKMRWIRHEIKRTTICKKIYSYGVLDVVVNLNLYIFGFQMLDTKTTNEYKHIIDLHTI